jgi:hypothetical protein
VLRLGHWKRAASINAAILYWSSRPLFDLANTVLQSRFEPQTATFQEKAFQVHNSIKDSDSVHVNFHGRLWAWLDALNLCSLSR